MQILLLFSILVFERISSSNCGKLSFTDLRGDGVIKEMRIHYQKQSPYNLTRGKPLFAEIDFVPRYLTDNPYVSVKVYLPKGIAPSTTTTPKPYYNYYQSYKTDGVADPDGKILIGFTNGKYLSSPRLCSYCTNEDISFTLPVKLLIEDDRQWCGEGAVPTIWVIKKDFNHFHNDDDNIAQVADLQKQIVIYNSPSSECESHKAYKIKYCVEEDETLVQAI